MHYESINQNKDELTQPRPPRPAFLHVLLIRSGLQLLSAAWPLLCPAACSGSSDLDQEERIRPAMARAANLTAVLPDQGYSQGPNRELGKTEGVGPAKRAEHKHSHR